MKTVGSLCKRTLHFCLQLQGVCLSHVRKVLWPTVSLPLPFNSPYMLILTPVVHWVITLRREQGLKGRKVLLEQSKQRTRLYSFLHSFKHARTTPALLQLPWAPVYTLADYASMHSLLSFVPLFPAVTWWHSSMPLSL